MKTTATAISLMVLLLGAASFSYAEEDDHDHHDDHGHAHEKCACVAKEMGMSISCDGAKEAVQKAMEYLEAPENQCKQDEKCAKEYFILQAHHDFCPHDVLPEAAENVLHDFEGSYEDCFIVRQFQENLSACPAVDCSDSAAFVVAADNLEANCTTACDSSECVASFQTILAGHDTCDEKDLPTSVEKALHNLEETCEAYLCNTSDKPYDPNTETCEDHDDHDDHDDDHDDDHGDGDHDDDHDDDEDHDDHDHDDEEKESEEAAAETVNGQN